MALSGLKVLNSDEQHIAEGACCYRPHHIPFPYVDEDGEGNGCHLRQGICREGMDVVKAVNHQQGKDRGWQYLS